MACGRRAFCRGYPILVGSHPVSVITQRRTRKISGNVRFTFKLLVVAPDAVRGAFRPEEAAKLIQPHTAFVHVQVFMHSGTAASSTFKAGRREGPGFAWFSASTEAGCRALRHPAKCSFPGRLSCGSLASSRKQLVTRRRWHVAFTRTKLSAHIPAGTPFGEFDEIECGDIRRTRT